MRKNKFIFGKILQGVMCGLLFITISCTSSETDNDGTDGSGGGGVTKVSLSGSISTTSSVLKKISINQKSNSDAQNASNAVSYSGYTVTAWGLSGVQVGESTSVNSDGSFTISNLDISIDYILKAQKGAIQLKCIISKEKLSGSNGQTIAIGTIDPVSTAVVKIVEGVIKKEASLSALAILGTENGQDLSVISNNLGDMVALAEMNVSAAIQNGTDGDASNDEIYKDILAVTLGTNTAIQTAISLGLDTNPGSFDDVVTDFLSDGNIDGDTSSDTTTLSVQTVSQTYSNWDSEITIDSTGLAIGSTVVTISVTTIVTVGDEIAVDVVDQNDPATAITKVSEGKTALGNNDIATAKIKFYQAYMADPTNKDANFGLAITEGIMLISDPNIVEIIKRWNDDVYPLVSELYTTTKSSSVSPTIPSTTVSGKPDNREKQVTNSSLNDYFLLEQLKTLFTEKLPQHKPSFWKKIQRFYKNTITSDDPSVSEMQDVMNLVIIPTIEDMINKLRVVEGQNYVFTVTKAMQGGGAMYDITLDDAEFYALDAALSALKSVLNIATAYDLNLADSTDSSLNKYQYLDVDPLASYNQTTFFTLQTGGAAKMQNALITLKEAFEKGQKAHDQLYANCGHATSPAGTCDANTDGLVIGSTDNPWPSDFESDYKKVIEEAGRVLAGATEISYDNGDNDTRDGCTGYNDVTSSDDKCIKIDITKFFNSPLDKTDMPTLAYDLSLNVALSITNRQPTHTVLANGETIYSNTAIKSDLPDWTLNGIFPDGNIIGVNGTIYQSTALLLSDENMTWGSDVRMAVDDSGNFYMLKSNYSWPPTLKLFKFNSSDGSLITTYTYTGNSNSWENSINGVSDITWHKGKLWASGNYYDANSQYQSGVFILELTNDLMTFDSTSTISFSQTDNYYSNQVSAITSDGTNLYLGIGYPDSTTDSRKSGIVKFNESVTEIPKTPFVVETTDDNWEYWSGPHNMSYGGGYLWVGLDGYIQKTDPVSGSSLKKYIGPDNATGLYHDSKLWQVDNNTLSSYIMP